MLINSVGEEDGALKEQEQVTTEEEVQNDAHEYQTASELFELMAKNHNFQPDSGETLTTRDLVILYKNIDLGTKLMSSANEFKKKRTNQYVETIVYNDEHESDSDISENFSNEDLNNVVLVNNERLDLLNNVAPLENILCHKYGNLELRSSSFSSDYDRQFLFKDPYIKEQLKKFDILTNSSDNGSVIPNSLLDYVCCKRLEDNYTFYMENIIKYVQRTIEQLKRISNGDFLTEKAKEKWREVNNVLNEEDGTDTKILRTSTSIPLHVERKVTGLATTWDEIVHSEVDVKYLTKILEKKIVLEIPKFLCGSYKLLSKCREDNVIVSCKSDIDAIPEEKESDSRIDVVFKLQRSETGHVISNISSIMVLQKSLANLQVEMPQLLPLPYELHDTTNNNDELNVNNDSSNAKEKSNNDKAIETQLAVIKDVAVTPNDDTNILQNHNRLTQINIAKDNTSIEHLPAEGSSNVQNVTISKNIASDYKDSMSISDPGNNEYSETDICTSDGIIKPKYVLEFSSESNYFDNELPMLANDSEYETFQNHISTQANSYRLKVYSKEPISLSDASFNITPADELRLTMQRLNIQSSLPEENIEDASFPVHHKRKSPVRKRLSSPYENKSLVLEEKKRKKLLEIRERREKKKLAMGEHCKVTKTKYGKASIMPQSSNSVTKLSITNKSFYNSIYGQTANLNLQTKPSKPSGNRNNKKDMTAKDSVSIDASDEEIIVAPDTAVNNQKYINRSYYLDDTVTEMMYLQMKQSSGEKDKGLESPSSPDSPTNIKMFNQLISLCSISELNMEGNTLSSPALRDKREQSYNIPKNSKLLLDKFRTIRNPDDDLIVVPLNTPSDNRGDAVKKFDPAKTTTDFRKSIDKIYNLMKKNKNSEESETKIVEKEIPADIDVTNKCSTIRCSTVQYTESGTSIKNQPTSSNLSSVSFEKDNNLEKEKIATKSRKNAIAVPKVIISTKSQTPKGDVEKPKNYRKRAGSPPSKTENPLKAISQLLHEFNNVQKTRQKSGNETTKSFKKDGIDGKSIVRQSFCKKSRSDSQSTEVVVDRQSRLKDKRYKPNPIIDKPKSPLPNKPLKRDMINIIEEYKEARGEAVRGPPKFSSRLHTLAQPKKVYVQAHIEECQMRYGRNVMSDRLQRRSNAPVPASGFERNKLGTASSRYKQRRSNNESPPPASAQRQSPVPPIEKRVKIKQASEICSPPIRLPTTSPASICDPSINTQKPSILKKKMVAVESYLQTHYGNSKSSLDSAQMLLEGLKSRVPVLPTDFNLAPIASVETIEESAIVGTTLHNIIETMIESQSIDDVDLELQSSSSIPFVGIDQRLDKIEIDCFGMEDEEKQSTTEEVKPKTESNCVRFSSDSLKDTYQTKLELEKLENALTRSISAYQQQKRLRMKNLTLTPRQSMPPQVLLLESGDVGSLLIQSPQNPNNVTNSLKKISNLTDSKISHRSIDIHLSKIPTQTLKVNYAFPIKNIADNILDLKTLNKTQQSRQKNTKTVSIQENFSKAQTESAAQVDIQEIITITNILPLNPVLNAHNDIKNKLLTDLMNVNNIGISEESSESKCDTSGTSNNTHEKYKSCSEMKVRKVPRLTSQPITEERHDKKETLQNKESKDYLQKLNDELSDNNVSLDAVDYTSSLDILAGLLNEIQKITTCQTMIANNEVERNTIYVCEENDHVNLLESPAEYDLKGTNDAISITSLENMRQLESSHSIFSYYVSNDDDQLSSNKMNTISEFLNCDDLFHTNVDKEVNVNTKNTLVDRFTDKPSVLLPVTVNHSTSVSNSLIGIFSQPSTQSMFSINETTYTTSLTTRTKIIELPPTTPKIKNYKDTSEEKTQKETDQLSNKLSKGCSKDKQVETKNIARHLNLKRTTRIERNSLNVASNKRQEVVISEKICNPNVDASIKMKRDVLVTVYSILVFTVFAALSFPKMLYDA